MTTLLLLTLAAAHAACDAPPDPDAFAGWVAEAARDPEAARRARTALPCLDVPLSPTDATLFHRAMAEDAWGRGAGPEALAEMRAARALSPTWSPPPYLRPLWEAAAPDPAAATLAWEGLVDGAAGKVYLDRAAILQAFAKGVWTTRYVLPVGGTEEKLPTGPVRRVDLGPPVGIAALPKPLKATLYTGAGLTVAGLTAFGLAVAWNAEFKDLDNPAVRNSADLADLGNKTNAATVAAWVLTGAGSVCVGAALVNVHFQ